MEKVILCITTTLYALCVFQRGIIFEFWLVCTTPTSKPKTAAPTIAPSIRNKVGERKNFSCNQFGCQLLAIFCWTHTYKRSTRTRLKEQRKKRDLNHDVFFHSMSNFHTAHLCFSAAIMPFAFWKFLVSFNFDGSVKAKKTTRIWCWFDFNTNCLTPNILAVRSPCSH